MPSPPKLRELTLEGHGTLSKPVSRRGCAHATSSYGFLLAVALTLNDHLTVFIEADAVKPVYAVDPFDVGMHPLMTH